MVDDRERDRRDAQRWREHLARTTALDQPRLYRVRLFESSREVPVGGPYPVVLDLTRGLPLEESELKLNELLRSLLRLAKVRPDKVQLHYLDVREWDNKAAMFQWPVTWPVEQ